jgi:hypothetical protein
MTNRSGGEEEGKFKNSPSIWTARRKLDMHNTKAKREIPQKRENRGLTIPFPFQILSEIKSVFQI